MSKLFQESLDFNCPTLMSHKSATCQMMWSDSESGYIYTHGCSDGTVW